MPPKQPPRPKSRDEFQIAIICALTLEADAVLDVFDHHWDEDEDGQSFGKAYRDQNAYSTGVIGQHNVVLAHLPGAGKVTAGNIASSCRISYPNISLALVIGICGGAPFYGTSKEEILLGDVIISTGIVQYDFGWRLPDRFEQKVTLNDCPGRPGLELRSLLSRLNTKRQQGKLQIATQNYLQQVLEGTKMSAGRPEGLDDNLFLTDHRHKHQDPSTCSICAACKGNSDPACDVALRSTCKQLKCDLQQCHKRGRLGEVEKENEKGHVGSNNETPFPMIHFGKFASGDSVIKSGEDRDQLTARTGAIGFEMESVGVWEMFPCVVIKGVSDYADSHKNDDWHHFAAASAAACTKAFLQYWDSTKQEMKLETEKEKLREALINSLRFPEIDERKNSLASPAPTTSQWIFHGCSQDSITPSYGSNHKNLEESSDPDNRKVENEDQARHAEDGSSGDSYRVQEGDPDGVFKPIDDRRRSSYDSMLDDDEDDEDDDEDDEDDDYYYGDDNDDDDDEDDQFAGLSHSDIKWDSFTDWLVSEKPCYWISGNPGSGKSTLMGYLLKTPQTSKYLTKWRSGTVILSHFYWKAGTQMQQSFKGLLCSLLRDLLSKNPSSVQIVQDMSMRARRLSPADWSQQELSNILLEYCKDSSRSICLFVDGLDEALPGQDVLNTLQFLKSMTSSNASVKICISSRPERLFRLHFDTYPSLKMHELTLLDIARYSQKTMIESTLLKPQGGKISDLASSIATLSDGIFLWAVLVTQSLVRGINNGDSREQTWKRLQLMPSDLMGLYHDILSRSAPDRPIYQKDVSLILNLLFLAAPSEAKSARWPTTPFMLTMATNPDLLRRYVDRGGTIRDHKLESKVKSMKNVLEAAFAGLVEVKHKPFSPHGNSSIVEQVVFPHRSAKDFLLDTVEGRNLWQPCDIPQEELLARYFKSLIADSRLHSENPKSQLSWGVDIRLLLSAMFEWEEKHNCTKDIILSFLELARLCFHRGHLQHIHHRSPELKSRCAGDQFLSHAAYGGSLRYVRCLLDEHGATTPEGFYCLLFSLCDPGTVDTRVIQLIEYILEQGYSPNWSTVSTPTTGHQIVASPWFRFLINLLNAPRSFFPDKPEPERVRLILEAIQMFLKSGASLESIFPVVVQISGFRDPSISFYLANCVTFSPEALLEQYMVFEMNAKAVIDLVIKSSPLALLRHNTVVQPDYFAARSYTRLLAFNDGGHSSLSIIEHQMLSGLFAEAFQTTVLHRLPESYRTWQKIMKTCRPLCRLVRNGYYWREILLWVMDD